ncbi:hypothetical protein PV735_39035 [Streptomyces turgidiscabies]|uniref:Uncharacterized protein n=2 Tax=Streptomyces TaxID=1883 RepID=L7EY99_STRT8|nr:hypothetical protein [Streptomyces turgidiscabies]ELP64403.1 hypothetical protein STRTUCAR8_04649 [Streptomyces turgidiscabies Car8]MDX3498643.1 hypothetical protein [Streptomyces turgidiscabies]GAQ74933.1 hypothetical protein T45_06714 [Streptomyces turgidiscabies]
MRQLASHTGEFAVVSGEDESAGEGAGAGEQEEEEASPGARLVGRAGWLLVACGLVLLPWLYVLATGLPDTVTVTHWPVTWVGLDALEAVCLVATGVLATRGDRRYPLAATAAATLLVVDAWFDTTTAAAGSDLVMAAAMALCAELPLAALCAWLAVRAPAPAPAPA